MIKNRLLIATLFLSAVAPAGFAQTYQDLYVIPVVAHVTGFGGAAFVSDVPIQNFQTTPLRIDFFFIPSGASSLDNVANLVSTALPTGSVTVPAGGSVIVRDILDGFDGKHEGLIGAVIARSDLPFAIISRAYGTTASGTVGQAVTPVRDFLDNTLGDTNNALAVGYLPGLTTNATFRTNIGFVAAAGEPGMRVEVTLKGADGATLGTRGFDIGARTFVHMQFPSQSIVNAPFDAAGAEFRITSGDGALAPYASVIDNRNSDAVFVSGLLPPNTPFSLRSPVPTLFRRSVDSMK